MAGRHTRKYFDLRYMFMRGLIEHERWQRTRHYLKQAAECTSRAIVSLELADKPVKSVQQAKSLERIGGETCSRLQKLEKNSEFSKLKPIAGKFVSSSGAILVSLLDATEEELYNGHSSDRGVFILEDIIKRRARNLSEETFHDEDTKGFCKAWWRLEVLIKRDYIRRRTLKKRPVLQLLPFGAEVARRLRGMAGLESTEPTVVACHLPTSVSPAQHTDTTSTGVRTAAVNDPAYLQSVDMAEMDNALYSNDKGLDGIVMLVDTREWGGDRKGLGQLCGLLEQHGVCYRTCRLATGDYGWVWRAGGTDVTLPCLVERKRADDMARTIHDGRYFSQINKMLSWKQGFRGQDLVCQLHYILERKPEEYVVHCADACQGVGQCGYPTLTQVQAAIADLQRHPGLIVSRTDNMEETVQHLVTLTQTLGTRIDSGDFDVLHVLEVAQASPAGTNTNLPNILGDHNKPHAAQETSSEVIGLPSGFDNRDSQTDLALAIKRSTEEAETCTILLTDTDGVEQLINQNQEAHSQQSTTQMENKSVLQETDFDTDLAIAIERSKLDYKHSMENTTVTDTSKMPNAVPHDPAHCSYGSLSKRISYNPCENLDNINDDLPRISRKRLLTIDTLTNCCETAGNVLSNSTSNFQEHTNLENTGEKLMPCTDSIESNKHIPCAGWSKTRTKRRINGRVYNQSNNLKQEYNSDSQLKEMKAVKQIDDTRTFAGVTNLTVKMEDTDDPGEAKIRKYSADYNNLEATGQEVEAIGKDTSVLGVKKAIQAFASEAKFEEMETAEYKVTMDPNDRNYDTIETEVHLTDQSVIRANNTRTKLCVANAGGLDTIETIAGKTVGSEDGSGLAVGANYKCCSIEKENTSMVVQTSTEICQDYANTSHLDVDAKNICDNTGTRLDNSCICNKELVNEMEYDSSEDLFIDIEEAKKVSHSKAAGMHGFDKHEHKNVDISQRKQFLGLAIQDSSFGHSPVKSVDKSIDISECLSQGSLPDLTTDEPSFNGFVATCGTTKLTHIDTSTVNYLTKMPNGTISEPNTATDSEHQKRTNIEMQSNMGILVENISAELPETQGDTPHCIQLRRSITTKPRNDKLFAEQINTVLTILPQLSRSRALLAIKESGGDVENCITALLEEDMDELSPVIDLTDSQEM